MNNQSIQVRSDVRDLAFGVRIKVIGVGGSGGNAIDHMINSGVDGVDFIAVNCDVQDLHHNKAEKKIHIGKNLTKGLGAGMNPEVGRRAAEETKNELQDALRGADMVFITCGLGGGTGTGASPIVAEVARNQDSLTLGVVTRPFSFEGAERARIAEAGLRNLIEVVDTVIVIPNDRLLEVVGEKTTLSQSFALCDDVLKNAVQGIAELIIKPGIINLDFADVRTIMAEAGPAIMGIGQAIGDQRAVKAAKKAINSPLLGISIEGARDILFAVAGGEDLTLHEINEAAKIITESVDPDAKIIFGAIHDENVPKGAIKITVIAAGFTNPSPNVIAGSPKTTGIRYEEKQNDGDESKDGFGDMDIPIFLRREKERVSPRHEPSEIRDIREPASNIFEEYHFITQSLSPQLTQGGKRNGRNFGDETRSNGLRDFSKWYKNFRVKAIKVFKITFSTIKKIAEFSLTIILGMIAVIVFGIYKAGTIIKDWFQKTIY